jgi:hypothetical protein
MRQLFAKEATLAITKRVSGLSGQILSLPLFVSTRRLLISRYNIPSTLRRLHDYNRTKGAESGNTVWVQTAWTFNHTCRNGVKVESRTCGHRNRDDSAC